MSRKSGGRQPGVPSFRKKFVSGVKAFKDKLLGQNRTFRQGLPGEKDEVEEEIKEDFEPTPVIQ